MFVLYSTDCPKCIVLKEKMLGKKIDFLECNDTEEMRELGITMVPVLKVNDKYLNFKEANSYINGL